MRRVSRGWVHGLRSRRVTRYVSLVVAVLMVVALLFPAGAGAAPTPTSVPASTPIPKASVRPATSPANTAPSASATSSAGTPGPSTVPAASPATATAPAGAATPATTSTAATPESVEPLGPASPARSGPVPARVATAPLVHPFTVSPTHVLVDYGNGSWKYQQVRHGGSSGFQASSFNDAGWPHGHRWLRGDAGRLSDQSVRNVHTAWGLETDMLLRHSVTVPSGGSFRLVVSAAIDNDIQIWVDGTDISGMRVNEGCAQYGLTRTLSHAASTSDPSFEQAVSGPVSAGSHPGRRPCRGSRGPRSECERCLRRRPDRAL